MVISWCIINCTSIYGWILIYSLYLELADLTKLEDLAHLRVKHKFFFIQNWKFSWFFFFLILHVFEKIIDGNYELIKCISYNAIIS